MDQSVCGQLQPAQGLQDHQQGAPARAGGGGWIAGLGVLPEFRRRGYGREILTQAVGRLASSGVERIALEVSVENEGALTLYESAGFEVVTGYDYYAVSLP